MKQDDPGRIPGLSQPHLKRHPELDQRAMNALDLHFARFITDLAGGDDVNLFLAAALVSHQTGQGHVCLDLRTVAGRPLQPTRGEDETRQYPEVETWRRSLEASQVVGAPGERFPLILDNQSRLYLYRYWEYEKDVAAFIRDRATAVSEFVDSTSLDRGLARYFRQDRTGERRADWQELAAHTAVTRRFCVITGGPGTGKTTTVAKVLALLREQPLGRQPRPRARPRRGWKKPSARLWTGWNVRPKSRRPYPPKRPPCIDFWERFPIHRIFAITPGIHWPWMW
jgi:ATP-dependent exoDNAse (exonuclease V) alpha subunit